RGRNARNGVDHPEWVKRAPCGSFFGHMKRYFPLPAKVCSILFMSIAGFGFPTQICSAWCIDCDRTGERFGTAKQNETVRVWEGRISSGELCLTLLLSS